MINQSFIKNILFFALILSLIQCGGGSSGGSSTESTYIKLSSLSSQYNLPDNDYYYEVEFFKNLDAEESTEEEDSSEDEFPDDAQLRKLNFQNLQSASESSLATLWNVNEQIYRSQVKGIKEGDYIIEVRFYKGNPQAIADSDASSDEEVESDEEQDVTELDDTEENADTEELVDEENEDNQVILLAVIQEEVTLIKSNNGFQIDLSSMDWVIDEFDLDADLVPNIQEIANGTNPSLSDTDADGVDDKNDLFPLNQSESIDFDLDGIGDNQDQDKDNDGLDKDQEMALGTSDNDSDSDDDTISDLLDNCPLIANLNQLDTDNDQLGDLCDDDADNDGISNQEENNRGMNPLLRDSDNDGILDAEDLFPINANESTDFDGDGLGDGEDLDDDNDGLDDDLELQIGTNPFTIDFDGDGIKDGEDNCPLNPNPNQKNTDGDSQGDICDLDIDGDSLSNDEEDAFGIDGFFTNKLIADTDGDGIKDSEDNCPEDSNPEQLDDDGDDFGNECDCDPNNPEINNLDQDLPDVYQLDSNCDGIDGNIYQGIFISTNGEASLAQNSPENPSQLTADLIEYAITNKFDLYFLEGEYIFPSSTLPTGISFFGGYTNGFLQRDLINQNNLSVIMPPDHQGFDLELNNQDQITITGIVFNFNENTPPDRVASSLLEVVSKSEEAKLVINYSLFKGFSDNVQETLLKIIDTNTQLISNQFVGLSLRSSLGLDLDGSNAIIQNNIFNMGVGLHTQGLRIIDSNASIINNTIDGGRHNLGSSLAIGFQESIIEVINNIIITQNNVEQFSLSCEGEFNAQENLPIIHHNLFLRLNTEALAFPVYSSCSGQALTSQDELIASDEIDVPDINIVDPETAPANLANYVDVNNLYRLVENSPAIDQGEELIGENEITEDFLGIDRVTDDPLDSFDLGAWEFIN